MECQLCGGQTPPDARFCPSCGTAIAAVAAAEERKLVTVVFCDLVGSTALSENLDPESLRTIVLRYFAAMRDQIERFGGTVEKFIGDAVMAVFGTPVMHEDDARRAAGAALGMLDALAELNTDLEQDLGVRLQVRIGVHTGPAVTTTDTSARQALVSGDTVNTAARLEQNAGAGEILIGAPTLRAIGPAARAEPVGPLRLKGKESAVMGYRLTSIQDDPPDPARRWDRPFVGRAEELAALDRALAAAVDGARLVTVFGEPGIGKTRLARAWLDHAARPLVHGAGRCRPYGDRGSLAPLADAVHQVLAGLADRPRPDVSGHADDLAVLDAGLLRDGTPGPSAEGTCAALARVLGTLASSQPVVLTIDDCQWAGDPLLDTLVRLAGMLERAPVLTICLARFELLDRRPAWVGDAALSRLVLSGLSAAECEAMAASATEVRAHLVDESTPPGLSELLDAAGGNPFHLEQLLDAARETGAPASVLPQSLQSLLGARIDRLGPAERTVIDLASVLGREFVPDLVRVLAGTGSEGAGGGPLAPTADGDVVSAAVTRLCEHRLLEAVPAPGRDGGRYRFSSTLIRDIAYQTMTKRTRAERHARAAAVLADRPEETPAAVAVHWEQAYRYRTELGERHTVTDALRLRAAGLFGTAGSQALARSDLAWAATLLGRSADLLRAGEPGWAAATRRLGEVEAATGHGGKAKTLLTAVLDDPSTDQVEAAHARLALATADQAPLSAVAATARDLLGVFASARDELGQARARIRIAQEQQSRGRHREAEDQLMTALAHAVNDDAEQERALALGAIGVSLWRGPVPVPAALDRCRELLAAHGGPRPVVRFTLTCPLAVLLALDDHAEEARRRLSVARQLADGLGYAEGAVVLPVFEAAVESLADRPGAALARLEEAAATARELGAERMLGTIACEAARLLLDLDDDAAAAVWLDGLDTSAVRHGADSADADGLFGRLAALRGAAEQALELVDRAVATAESTESPVVQALAALDRATALKSLGRPRDAAVAAKSAQARFRNKGHLPGVRQATAFMDQLAMAPERD